MKAGLTSSVIMHAALLGFGLFSLSAPRPFEVADVEAFPVDIVPVESITQVQQGEKKAPAAEKAAPKPTERPDPVPDAREVGENDVDLKTPPTPEPKPREVETAEAAAPEPKPEPAPEPKPEAPKVAKLDPKPVPATEVTPDPKPKQEVKPEPVPDPVVAETPDAESVTLPNTAPSPEARPQPPQAQTAKAPERKDSDKPAEKKTAARDAEKKDDVLDDVAALLNKQKASGGGAKRSTETASLGAKKTTSGQKLTQSEMDALRGQIQRCWNVPAGAIDAQNLRVSVKFSLDRSGAIEGRPVLVDGGGASGVERAAAESALRAVARCAPYTLPVDKYDAWAEVLVNFDPSEMF